jgi:amidase
MTDSITASLATKSAAGLAALIKSGDVSPVELMRATLDRVERYNSDINGFVYTGADEALSRAQQIERAVHDGEDVGPLCGVPVAMKDLYDSKAGWPTTMGGVPCLRDNIATTNSLWVERMEASGAIIVGKTNAAVFGFRGTSDNPLFGPSRNPFDLTYNSGGSSGGSAAAVAAGLVPIGQATDGGGSTRIPAAFCGLVGLKPTSGRIPMVIRPNAFAGTSPFLFDGAVTRTVEDTVLTLEMLEGYDSRDPFASRSEKLDRSRITGNVKGVRIAYSPDLDDYPVEEEIRATVKSAVSELERGGAIIDEVRLGFTADHLELGELWGHLIMHSQIQGLDALKNEGTDILRDHPDDLTELHRSWIDRVLAATTREQHKHQLLRTMVYDAVQGALDNYDLLITPTTACVGIKNNTGGDTIGPSSINGVPVEPLVGWALTSYFNYTGHPAISVPAGMSSGGLPIGMQIAANKFDDESVLNASLFIETALPWSVTYQSLPSFA